MQPPKLFAVLPVLDRFTLPRYSAETLAGLACSGRVNPRRLEAQQDRIGPVVCTDLVHAVADRVRQRVAGEPLSALDEVTRERLHVEMAEAQLGARFVGRTVAGGTAEAALPFLRWGRRETAVAAIIALNGRESTRYSFPLDRAIVQQAADAILDRGAEDLTLGGPTTMELARHVRSRALFEEIAVATDRALSSEQPEVIARATRGEAALFEMLTNPECQPYGEGGRDNAAARQQRLRVLDVTARSATIRTAWDLSGQSTDAAGAVLEALGRAAVIGYAQLRRGGSVDEADRVRDALATAETVMRALGDAGIDAHQGSESVKTLRDTAVGFRANSYSRGSLGWSSRIPAAALEPYNATAKRFVALTDEWRWSYEERARGAARRAEPSTAHAPVGRVTDQVDDAGTPATRDLISDDESAAEEEADEQEIAGPGVAR